MAVAALWLLARIRFQDLPVTPNPLPSVLSQLASGPKYDDLAAEIAQVQARVQPFLHALAHRPAAPGALNAPYRSAAIRFRDDLVVTLVPDGITPEQWSDAIVVARDPATGLAVLRIPDAAAMALPVPWTPRRPQQARYLVASDLSAGGVSLRPAFVGSLDPIDSAMWPEQVWGVPEGTELTPGAFLFTPNAELVGVVISHTGRLAIVPGATVLAEAERLLANPPAPSGTLGLEVQELTPPVASLTGASAGVVVTWVDRDGPARGHLLVGDVIEAVDGRPLPTREHWNVRASRASAGEALTLRVRRRGELRDVPLTASAPAAPPSSRPLGLALRERARIGAEVIRVEPGSSAERAGLAAGDLITLVADVPAPTPGQVTRSFAAIGPGQRVMVGFTRGAAHHVTTLER
jgi:S1-C subfamily serine protease